MNIDEVVLRAYVDGELPAAQAAMVESALAGSEELREQAAALRMSQLPYKAAFAAQKLPDVPTDLQRRLQSWIAMSRESSAEVPLRRRRWLAVGGALAASFAAGLWVPVPFRLNPGEFPDEPWVQAVAQYQALYVRETVDRVAEDPERTRALLTAFAEHARTRIAVPDLRPAGLAFRRAQRLAVGDSPLIQMMYLPAVGKPMSLWVLHVARGDAGVISRRVDGVGVTTWRRNGLAYVMVADMPIGDAKVLGERLASGELPVLYETNAG